MGQPEQKWSVESLLERIESRQDVAGGHDVEARMAEGLGLSTAALRAWQLAVRDDPEDTEAWRALSRLHAERGERGRAEACQRRLSTLTGEAPLARPTAPAPSHAPAPVAAPEVSDGDRVRFVHLFAGREGVHARMWRDPRRGIGYSPVHQPLGPEIVRAHLEGSITAGIYLLQAGDQVTLFVLDLDATPAALREARLDAHKARSLRALFHQEGLALLAGARALGLDPLLEDSGYKGRHLWCFLERATEAAEVRRVGAGIVSALRPSDPRLNLEFFPRQDQVGPQGLGNLVKLPLGIHLRNGRRAALLDDAGEPLRDPFARLRTITRTPLPDPAALPAPRPEAPAPKQEPAPAAPARPDWSEADYDASAEVGPVLRGCAVLRRVVERGLAEKRLERGAAVALQHTLGHSADGVRACNYLFAQIPDFPPNLRMKSPLRGNPTSCAKIRSRLADVVAQVPCDCRFPEAAGRYPNPTRHRELAPPPRPKRVPLDELLAARARARQRLERLALELEGLERSCVLALAGVPGGRWAAAGGEWRLERPDGEAVIRWVASGGEE